MKLPFVLSQLLPHKRTTEGEALRTMSACGISPDEVAWKVRADGTFAFGLKHPDAAGLTDSQTACLIEWTRRERVKLGLTGWETGQSDTGFPSLPTSTAHMVKADSGLRPMKTSLRPAVPNWSAKA